MRRSIAGVRYIRDLEPLLDAPASGADPRVSVVIATYNRSNVLRLALESVRAQTMIDWEAIVVGDACTDDTAEVVAGLGDSRIRYFNLPLNTGDQSGPNSVAARLARGSHISWLSHDDLWFPDHLERLLEVSQDADAVLASSYRVGEIGPDGLADPATRIEVELVEGSVRLTGHEMHVASTWLFSASLVSRLGDWRSATRVRYASSQDYLYRAWSSGARLVSSPVPSVVVVPSIVGDRAYGRRRDVEQALLAPTVLSGSRAPLDEVVCRTQPEAFRLPDGIGVIPRRRSLARRWIAANSERIHQVLAGPLARLGTAPRELAGYLVGQERGESQVILRMMRGLSAQTPTSRLTGDMILGLREQVEDSERERADLAAAYRAQTTELERTQAAYREREADLAALNDAYRAQTRELERTQAAYFERAGELETLRATLPPDSAS